MKYILIEHGEGNDPKQLRVFDTLADRARATREAILGPPDAQNKDLPCDDLLELATDGIVHYEGDPSLEWIDAEVTQQDAPLPTIMGRQITRAEVIEGLRENLAAAMKFERLSDSTFRRWPDMDAIIEHIEKHGLPPLQPL
jgi:hypothetical protein